MIRSEAHGDVIRFVMSTWQTRLVGITVSTYLVRGVLIDCGFPRIEEELAALLAAERPRGVMVTHAHEDHAGNIALVRRLGIPLAAGALTIDAARAPRPLRFYRRFTWAPAPSLTGEIVPFESSDLELRHLPGHSPDHHVVWDPQERTLFSGDLFIGVKVRVAHPHEQPSVLAASLRAAAALEPRRMFDAHRGLVTRPVESLRAKADWLDEVRARIASLAAAGATETRIIREALGGEPWIGRFSAGDYSARALVRAVLREQP